MDGTIDLMKVLDEIVERGHTVIMKIIAERRAAEIAGLCERL